MQIHLSKSSEVDPKSRVPREPNDLKDFSAMCLRNQPQRGFWTSCSNGWQEALSDIQFRHVFEVKGNPNILEIGSKSKRLQVEKELGLGRFWYWREIARRFDAVHVHGEGIGGSLDLWHLDSMVWFNTKFLSHKAVVNLL